MIPKKSLDLFEPQFLHLWNRNDVINPSVEDFCECQMRGYVEMYFENHNKHQL